MRDPFGKPVLHGRNGWKGRAVCADRRFWTDGLWVLREGTSRPAWYTADSLREDTTRETWETYTRGVIGGPQPAPRGVFGIGVEHPISGRVGHIVCVQQRHNTAGAWVTWSSTSRAPSWHPLDALAAHGTPYRVDADPDDLRAQIRAAELDGAIA